MFYLPFNHNFMCYGYLAYNYIFTCFESTKPGNLKVEFMAEMQDCMK